MLDEYITGVCLQRQNITHRVKFIKINSFLMCHPIAI